VYYYELSDDTEVDGKPWSDVKVEYMRNDYQDVFEFKSLRPHHKSLVENLRIAQKNQGSDFTEPLLPDRG